jgi:hypothetical protein
MTPEDLRSLPYEDYLKTDHWQQMRAAALERADGACQVCNASGSLSTHHRRYDRVGCEEPADLTVLCVTCHALFHAARQLPQRREPARLPPRPVLVAGILSERIGMLVRLLRGEGQEHLRPLLAEARRQLTAQQQRELSQAQRDAQ